MKSYGYKFINYVFFIAVYNLLPPLDQFIDAIHQKSLGLESKNLLSQFLRSSSLLKVTPPYGSTKSRKDSNLWVQGPENTSDAEGPPI